MSIMKIVEKTILRTEGSRSFRNSELMFVALLIAVGTFLRFWGLGNVGLHGDEKTTIFPALAVLEQGGAYFPSGMYYARALAHTYLISGSIWIFGESEWAARLPSALVGSMMPLFAFFLGRRFLTPRFNLVFLAVIAVLPALIELSQTARMYIFLIAALMLFGASVFRWERQDTTASLVAAFLVWLIALHFHALAILAAPLFLFPGLVRRSWKNVVQGGIVIAACLAAYRVNGFWIGAQYPRSSERPPREVVSTFVAEPSLLQQFLTQFPWVVVICAIIALAVLVSIGLKSVASKRFDFMIVSLLIAAGYAACAALQYHAGLLVLFLGTVIWLRNSVGHNRWLYALWGIVGVTAVLQAVAIYQTGDYPGRQLIGAMVGEPSIWPILRFAEFSPFAAGSYCVVLAYGAYRLATRQRIPDHMLLFAIAVWVPLLAIGFETWYLPPRYTAGALPFFLLCCIAGVAYLVQCWKKVLPLNVQQRAVGDIATVLLVIAIANPVQLAEVVNSGYERHPDHKGAAEFLMSLPITDDDVIIAEDVLQQTYYLGKVDYWLRNFDNARGYAVVKNGVNVDQYTSVPIIGDGNELVEILDNNLAKRVFIIGSGEISPVRDEWARGRDIGTVLQSARLKVIYEGRDGISKVWSDRK